MIARIRKRRWNGGLLGAFVLGASTAVAAAPTEAIAQGWEIELQAGRLRYESGPAFAGATTLSPGLRYVAENSWFRVSAGIPLAENDPRWAGAGFGHRVAMRAGLVTAGIDVSGQAMAYRSRLSQRDLLGFVTTNTLNGFAVSGELFPVLNIEGRRAKLELRAGVAAYQGKAGEEEEDRSLRSADARLTLSPTTNIIASGTVRGFRSNDGDFGYGGITAYLVHGSGVFWGTVGQWFGAEVDSMPWASGLTLFVDDRVSLTALARRETFDPLYRIPEQTSWSVGVRVALRARPRVRAPVPAFFDNGRATIALAAADARGGRALIAGDFNAWQPQPMTREGSRWIYTVALEPGVYNYAFVSESGEWFVPESVPGRKEDGMGGHVAILIVR